MKTDTPQCLFSLIFKLMKIRKYIYKFFLPDYIKNIFFKYMS